MKSCAFTLVTLCPLPSNDTAQQTCTIGLRTVPVLRMKLWFTLRATGLTTSRSISVMWTSWNRSNSIRWFIRHLDTVDFLFYRVLNSDGCFVSYHMNSAELLKYSHIVKQTTCIKTTKERLEDSQGKHSLLFIRNSQ